ncbi:hypothetical protein [Aquihabitans sp. McL0605]|uniref:hypothetical protein n=1 Tax=Aquihabitans sp. McL0605 TaxID=3415671 RepID=UPI003CEB7511
MRNRTGLIVAAWVVALGVIGVAPAPSGAADQPVLTTTATEPAPDEPITVTLTGCTGPAPPTMERLGSVYDPAAHPEPVLIAQSSPGVWQTTSEAAQYGDSIYTASCGGATSAPLRIDAEWRAMFSDPFYETYGALHGVDGSDCDTGEPVKVDFRVADRVWEVQPSVDARGDWYAVPPLLPDDQPVEIIGRCGDYRYLPSPWSPAPGLPKPPSPAQFLSPGEGAPGTAYQGFVTCGGTSFSVTAVAAGDDVLRPIPVDRTPGGSGSFDAVAGTSDVTYDVQCGTKTDRMTFDVEAPVMRLGPVPVPAIVDLVPTQVEGTDCPPGTQVSVHFTAAGGSSTAHAPIDLFGDWLVPLPSHLPVGTTVSASCGAVAYDPIALPASAMEGAAGPVAAPTAAAPAVAVAGDPTYTG